MAALQEIIKNNKHWVRWIGVVLLLIVGLGVYLIANRNSAARREQALFMEEEKVRMQEELDRLSEDYDQQMQKIVGQEQVIQFGTDSILQELEQDKATIRKLQNELKTVKSSNAKRIRELTDEISTLRNLLRSYVMQIDSLYAANRRLSEENTQVRAALNEASGRASQLSMEKEQLAGVVERAAVLRTQSVAVKLLNKRGRQTKYIDKAETIEIQFVVPQNVTATVGNKEFFVRILTPQNEALGGGKTFEFEGQTLTASTQKTIEYTGEETRVVIYRPITETMLPGTYRADLFCDGHLVGKTSFTL